MVAPHPVRASRPRRASRVVLAVLLVGLSAAPAIRAEAAPTARTERRAAVSRSWPAAEGRLSSQSQSQPPAGALGSPAGQRVRSLDDGATARELAATLAGSGVTVRAVTFTGSPYAAGTFRGLTGIGVGSGVALATGSVQSYPDAYVKSDVLGPNRRGGNSVQLGAAGDRDLDRLVAPARTSDAAVLELRVVPAGARLSLDFVFGSDEYDEYVGSYNDLVGLWVDRRPCGRFAGGRPVSVSTVNRTEHAGLFRDNARRAGGSRYATELDGFAAPLHCRAAVTPGRAVTVKIAVADVVDDRIDSAVLLRAHSLRSTAIPDTRPTATDQRATVAAGGSVSLRLAAADSGGDPLGFAVVTPPEHGRVTVRDGVARYVPDAGFTGLDRFRWTASDGRRASRTAEVTLRVVPVLAATGAPAGVLVAGVAGLALLGAGVLLLRRTRG